MVVARTLFDGIWPPLIFIWARIMTLLIELVKFSRVGKEYLVKEKSWIFDTDHHKNAELLKNIIQNKHTKML